jgi:NRPS condensation-like uncharacterized protein
MTIENLHEALPETLPVEICDAIQFFLQTNADQQMRFVLRLSQHIDVELLRKAARLSIYQEPIFSYTYRENDGVAHWQKQPDVDASALVELRETTEEEEAVLQQCLTSAVTPFDFPLVRIYVIRKGPKDLLCLNVNHTPLDGAGLKAFVRILAENYTQLSKDAQYLPDANLKGDRGIRQVMNRFTLPQKIQFARQGLKKPKRYPSWSFDWGKTDRGNKNQFALTRISAETFLRIKAYGKQHQSTVNDVLITAFMRSFVHTKAGNREASKPLIVPVNLRKYLRPGQRTGLCSLTGSMILSVGQDVGSSFEETLAKVTAEMACKKSIHAEMATLTSYLLSYKLMGYGRVKAQTMQRKMPPIPLFTNIGVIENTDVNFNTISVDDAFVTGVVSYGNYFTMGCSTFNNEMTLSIGFNGNDVQLQKAQAFLHNLKTTLETIK